MTLPATKDLLTGCILSAPTRFPGRVEVVECVSEDQAKQLTQIPGAYQYRGDKRKGIPPAFFVPQSYVDAGKYPGVLHGWSDDQSGVTPNLERHLREHQRRAVSFVRAITPQREGCIVAADMGLGKVTISLQALNLDGLLEEPGIICGPLPAAAAWTGPDSDAVKHFDLHARRLEGKKDINTELLEDCKHFYCHYEILSAWWMWLTSVVKPAWIIFDELHLLMHADTQRAEAAYKLSHWHTVEKRIGLTGTPIPNYRIDLWSQLRIVQPRQWGEKRHLFGVYFCGGHREVIAAADEGDESERWVYNGETNDIALRKRLAGTMLRYTRYDVEGALPDLDRRITRYEPKPGLLDEYKAAERDIVGYLRSKGDLEVGATSVQWGDKTIELKASETAPQGLRLRAITTLIGLLSNIKAEETVRGVASCLLESSHIVVFTWRRPAAALIVKQLNELLAKEGQICNRHPLIIGPVDGTMKQRQRQELAVTFADASSAVYVATLGAAGIAINELSAGSDVIFSDLHWNPSVLTQAESRVHRDGSRHEKVRSHYVVVKGTIDEFLIHHLTMKTDSAAAVSPNDTVGLNLVADLSVDRGMTSEESLDQICSLLAEMEE